MEIYAATEKGLREKNEDSYVVIQLRTKSSESVIFVVCDGMGGHEGGEIASEIGCKSFISSILGNVMNSEPDEESVKAAIEDANKAVIQAQSTYNANMGTTITSGVIKGCRLFIANAGDTECLLIRDGNVRKLTRNHSLAGLLEEKGVKDAEQNPLLRSKLTSFLGKESLDIHYDEVELKEGDIILTASDGLFEGIKKSDILKILGMSDEDKAKLLCDSALKNGSMDNITVVLIKVSSFSGAKTLIWRG